MNQKIF